MAPVGRNLCEAIGSTVTNQDTKVVGKWPKLLKTKCGATYLQSQAVHSGWASAIEAELATRASP